MGVRLMLPKNAHHEWSAAERFIYFSPDRPKDGCWEWQGRRLPNGYGQFSVRGRWAYAHRASWEMHVGPIPAGMHVCHHCDNPPCVNPSHLFLGTMRDNLQDAARKGRTRNTPRYGPDNNKTKLTDGQIAEIRQRFEAGETNKSALAREFGVHHSRIWQLINHTDRR